MRTKLRILAAIIIAAGTVLTVPTVSSATPVKDGNGAKPCIDIALKQHADQWVCLGGELTTASRGADGHQVIRQISTGEKPIISHVTASTMASDDYDTWCETGSICHRFINDLYIEETKGNAAYGNQSGVIGNYDVIIRTNLNGRQAQWRVTLIWDSGPNLDFLDDYMNCIEIIPFWADQSCGHHYAGNVYELAPYGWRWDSNWIYGNRLANADDYKGEFKTLFTPQGYSTYIAAPLDTLAFTCPSGDTWCRF